MYRLIRDYLLKTTSLGKIDQKHPFARHISTTPGIYSKCPPPPPPPSVDTVPHRQVQPGPGTQVPQLIILCSPVAEHDLWSRILL